MQSKGKPSMTVAERGWVENIKAMRCGVCGVPGPSEAHELKQGQWFTAIPLCPDCHRGPRNGIHGEKRMWAIQKLDELAVLNDTIRRIFH